MIVITIRTESKTSDGGIESSIRTALMVEEGRKYLHLIWPDSGGIRIRKVPREFKYTELPDYPIAKAKKTLRLCGRKFGITKAAKKALRVTA